MIQITKGQEARELLMQGIGDIVSAVSSTFGPHGKNVMIQQSGMQPHITKDGVTVAKHIWFSNPIKDMGASLIREVTQKTADEVGDGTTSTAIITHKLLEEIYKEPTYSDRKIINNLKKAETIIIEEIKKASFKIEKNNRKDLIFKVANISANGNEEIASNVTEAYMKSGDQGYINVKEGKEIETKIIHEPGYIIKSGYESNAFVNNYTNLSCTFEDAKVLISADPIKDLRYITEIVQECFQQGKKVLIICDEIEPGILSIFSSQGNNEHLCVILAYGYGDNRFETLYDIAAITNGKVLREKDGRRFDNFTFEDLGEVQKVISYKDRTVLIGKENSSETDDRIRILETEIETMTNDLRKDQARERLAILTGGVVTIEVGANTKIEMKEKKDLYDDSVLAVKAALQEGIVPGGGFMLRHIAYKKIDELPGYLHNAIIEPFFHLLDSTGVNGINKDWISNPKAVLDILSDDYYKNDFIEAGICDPASVVISSVKNAISIAVTVLSTENILSLEQ